jgi:hypothetical protein
MYILLLECKYHMTDGWLFCAFLCLCLLHPGLRNAQSRRIKAGKKKTKRPVLFELGSWETHKNSDETHESNREEGRQEQDENTGKAHARLVHSCESCACLSMFHFHICRHRHHTGLVHSSPFKAFRRRLWRPIRAMGTDSSHA